MGMPPPLLAEQRVRAVLQNGLAIDLLAPANLLRLAKLRN
jgi:hypothetical protein